MRASANAAEADASFSLRAQLEARRFDQEHRQQEGELCCREEACTQTHDPPQGATPGQISLAWLLAKEPTIIPIPGSTKVANIEENVKAAEIKLSADEVASIDKLVHEFEVSDHARWLALLC